MPSQSRQTRQQKVLFDGIAKAVTDHLTETYGPPEKNTHLVAGVAVALLQASLAYFALTGAPPSVVKNFVDELLAGQPEPEPAAPTEGGAS